MKRMIHLDLLRILACFSVVMLHSSAIFWYGSPVTGRVWQTVNAYNALSRYGVPVFVMLSGALFLSEGKQISVKRLYLHNIARLAGIYVIWSCLYGAVAWIQAGADRSDIMGLFRTMLRGHYHLWFLPMLAGLYVLVPILRSWIAGASKKNLEYFLLVFYIMQILRSTLLAFAEGHTEWEYVLNIFEVEVACRYVGYFVLGYYMVHIGIDKRWHKWVYAGGIAGGILNMVCSAFLSVRAEEPRADIFDCYSAFTFAMIVAIFLFFTSVMGRRDFSDRTSRLVSEVSSCTLGIYIMHVGLLELIQGRLTQGFADKALITIPLLAVSCFAVCGIITFVIRRIPLLKKLV